MGFLRGGEEGLPGPMLQQSLLLRSPGAFPACRLREVDGSPRLTPILAASASQRCPPQDREGANLWLAPGLHTIAQVTCGQVASRQVESYRASLTSDSFLMVVLTISVMQVLAVEP